MSVAARRILKNAGFLMISQMITWGMTLALTVVMARYLGPTGLGQLRIADSIWIILMMLVGFGTDVLLTKEIARDPAGTGELFGTAIVMRCLFFVGVLGLLGIYTVLVGYQRDTELVIWLLAPSYFLMQLEASVNAALQGLERMEFISIGAIIGRLVHVLVLIVALLNGARIFQIAIISALGPLVILLIEWVALARLHPSRIRPRWDRVRWLIVASLPYFLSQVFLVVYANLDVVIISVLVDEKTTGWYGVAAQFMGTLVFVPSILMQAIFPAMARMRQQDPHDQSQMMRRSLQWLLALGVPMGIGLLVVAKPLVELIYGAAFIDAGGVLSVMGVVLIALYVNILLGRYLVATDRQNWWTLTMALAAAATIPLDLVLVPWSTRALGNGAYGGALSYLVTEFAMLIVGVQLLPRGLLLLADLGQALRTLAAGLIMGAVVWLVRDAFLAVPVLIGIVTYVPLALLLRVIPSEDLTVLAQLAGSALRQFRARLSGHPTPP